MASKIDNNAETTDESDLDSYNSSYSTSSSDEDPKQQCVQLNNLHSKTNHAHDSEDESEEGFDNNDNDNSITNNNSSFKEEESFKKKVNFRSKVSSTLIPPETKYENIKKNVELQQPADNLKLKRDARKLKISLSKKKVPDFVTDYLKRKRIDVQNSPFQILKTNIFKTLMYAYEYAQSLNNKAFQDYCYEWFETMEALRVTDVQHMQIYYVQLKKAEHNLNLKCGRNINVDKHHNQSTFLPPTPFSLTDLHQSLYPNWTSKMKALNAIRENDNAHFLITYLITCYYNTAPKVNQIEKLYQKIKILKDNLAAMFNVEL